MCSMRSFAAMTLWSLLSRPDARLLVFLSRPRKGSPMKRRVFLQSSLVAAAYAVPGFRAAHALARSGPVPDVVAVTGDNREITLRGKEIADLAAQLRGQLLLAGDNG